MSENYLFVIPFLLKNRENMYICTIFTYIYDKKN